MVFARIPTVLTHQELLDKAFVRANKINVGSGPSALAQARTKEVSRIRTAQTILVDGLLRYVKAFPSFEELHPFHRELADLVADEDAIRKSLGALQWAQAQVSRVGDEAANRAKRARSIEFAVQARRAAYGRFSSVLEQVGPSLRVLAEARDRLKKLPTINPAERTIVVAGYPNVGKSSFIRRVSSAEPEVAVYPFTTKGILVGHLEDRREPVQVVDTPGLLDRPMEERNPVERQAVLALAHLGDVVVFLFDPSEHCGYPMEAQESLLHEVRKLFPEKPILEVENKMDIRATASRRLRMSSETGENVAQVLEAALAETRRRERRDVVEGDG